MYMQNFLWDTCVSFNGEPKDLNIWLWVSVYPNSPLWIHPSFAKIVQRFDRNHSSFMWDKRLMFPSLDYIGLGHFSKYCLNLMCIAVADSAFPVVGRQPHMECANLLFGKKFGKDCMKMKGIGPRGGHESLAPLPPTWIRQYTDVRSTF